MLNIFINAIALILIAATVLLVGIAPIYAMYFKDEATDLSESETE